MGGRHLQEWGLPRVCEDPCWLFPVKELTPSGGLGSRELGVHSWDALVEQGPRASSEQTVFVPKGWVTQDRGKGTHTWNHVVLDAQPSRGRRPLTPECPRDRPTPSVVRLLVALDSEEAALPWGRPRAASKREGGWGGPRFPGLSQSAVVCSGDLVRCGPEARGGAW